MKPTEKQKQTFKAKLKKEGLNAVNYEKLTTWEKQIYNGIKSAAGRSKLRVNGKFIAAQQERKIKKLAGNIDINNPTEAQKKAIDNILSNWIEQKVNNVRLLENVNRYNTLLINGRKIDKITGIKFLSDLITIYKTKHNAAIIIFKTFINEKQRAINVTIPKIKK